MLPARPVVAHRRGHPVVDPLLEDHDREARLSLSYYAEKLKGPGLSAVYVHDELPDQGLEKLSAFAVPAVPVSGRLFSADSAFDERVAARPELLAGFAAVWGGR